MIQLNGSAIHTRPSIWGADSLEFKPSRWLEVSTETPTCETLREPPRGTFIPCPRVRASVLALKWLRWSSCM